MHLRVMLVAPMIYRTLLCEGMTDHASCVGCIYLRKEKAINEVDALAAKLAELIKSGKCGRQFDDREMILGWTIRVTRLKRLTQPLYLGDNGIIYRRNPYGRYRPVQLRHRNLEGVEYIGQRLKWEIDKLSRRQSSND